MILADDYSPRVREAITPEDRAHIRAAHPLTAKAYLSRGFRGRGYLCRIVLDGGITGEGADLVSPRRAWDKAMRDLSGELPGIVSLLGGVA